MVAQPQKIRILTSSERAEEALRFVLPNPGDVMIALVFGWSAFCFFLVTSGGNVLKRVARLARSEEVRDALLASDETLLTFIMLGGCVALIGLVFLCYTYKKVFIGVTLVSLTFASCTWMPLHNAAFVLKYLAIIFLGSFGALFAYRNFWRMLSSPYIRLFMFYFGWVALVQLVLGGRVDDFWYLGTDAAFIFGFAIAYVAYVDDTRKLDEFNQVIAWAALAILFLHMLAPILINDYSQAGRFQSMFNRATGFAVFFSPAVLAMFWMGMRQENRVLRQVFVGAAMGGLVLILWSGTRSAMLGLTLSVFILWWVFRTRIFIYMFVIATLGLVAQIVGTSSEADFQALVARFEGGDGDLESGSGRFEIWRTYFQLWLQSPIFGYSLTGVKRELLGAGVQQLADSYGLRIKTTAPHNAFIGMGTRFGIIGLIVLLTPIFIALRRGRQVIMNPEVPAEDKQAYCLPVAMVVVICITSFFEDALGASGKGTVSAFLLFPYLIFCEVHGRKLLEKATNKSAAELLEARSKLRSSAEGAGLSPKPLRA